MTATVRSLALGSAAAVILGGCAAVSGPHAKQKSVVSACNGYASALATAGAAKREGKLSKQQIKVINKARKVANPICEAPNVPSTQQALNKVTQATHEILTHK